MPARPELRRLRPFALVEGTTLIVLLLVAVPLKHLAGQPAAVSVMGPLHGLAFLAYVWGVLAVATAAGWPWRRTAVCLLAAAIPFGSFAALAWLGRRPLAAA